MAINSINGGSQSASMMRPPHQQNLTEEQKTAVSSVLSDYDADSLTEEDAIAIVDAFRDTGIKPGQGLFEAISNEGFDAKEIGSLAGPPKTKGMASPPPPPPSGNGTSGLNTEALAELQSILDQYDLENITSEEESELLDKLDNSGLLMSGMLFNTAV